MPMDSPRPLCEKRPLIWICMALHLIVLGLPIYPGLIVIPWLMQWLTGPGA
jgi:hypothetical protein